MEDIKCNQLLSSSFIPCNEILEMHEIPKMREMHEIQSSAKNQRRLGTIEYHAKDGNVFYATVRKQGIVATKGNWQYIYKDVLHWLKMQFNVNLHNPLFQ